MGHKIIMVVLGVCFSVNELQAQDVKKIIHNAEYQAALLYKEVIAGRNGRQVFPRTLNKDSVKLVHSGDWTSGFWPGILWFMYKCTGKQEWKAKAEEFTRFMEREPLNRSSHDVGFKVYNSYGNAYKFTKNEEYKEQIIQGAATLITRFNTTTGCIRSWDFGKWQYPVIIDNMMNLELLFAATRLSGDSSYYKIATRHANTTMKNHFRPDFSSYHVLDYDTMSGKVIGAGTLQGYADTSSWARGQAWALYGFTMCYRETKDPAYLKQAEGIASFLINHPKLPADKVTYWDFDRAGMENEPRDVSAAAIIASALYELKDYSKNKKQYKKTADHILKNLAHHYRAEKNTSKGFILLHSTGHKPVNGEVDVPLIYADYYFLEALMRKNRLGN